MPPTTPPPAHSGPRPDSTLRRRRYRSSFSSPPQSDLTRRFAARLSDTLPEYEVASPTTDEEAIAAIRDADAAALINGVGGIGHETARLCEKLEMGVIGIATRPAYDLPCVQLHPPEEPDDVPPRADFVISTVPHTPETEATFNARRLQLMKSTAYFINVGRGKVCKIDDPADAIESGENLPERRFQVTLDNARRFLRGGPLASVVDKARWYRRGPSSLVRV